MKIVVCKLCKKEISIKGNYRLFCDKCLPIRKKEYDKEYRKKNYKKIKNRIDKCRESPDFRKKQQKWNNKWRVKNPEKVKFYRLKSEKKRVQERKVNGNHTFEEWELLKKQYGFKCPACGKSEPEIKLTEDHIIPLSKGGSDWIENIQPLCQSCNSRKHTKITCWRKLQ